MVVSGFTQYRTKVSDLPPVERNKVDATAQHIIASFGFGRKPVIGVLLVGHADQDLGKGPDFEHRMSLERGGEVEEALRLALDRRAAGPRAGQVKSIVMRVEGMGARQRLHAYPRDETQRAANRRVAIYLAEAMPEFWTFWTSGPYQTVRLAFASNAPRPGNVGVPGGTPFYINPDVFDFTPGPPGSNWQRTSCVPIKFGHGGFFLFRKEVVVGVIVDAPLALRDGHKISLREAQLDAANAATAAAYTVKGLLDAGLMIESEIQPRFVGFMGGAILANGLGYRVTGCHPKAAT